MHHWFYRLECFVCPPSSAWEYAKCWPLPLGNPYSCMATYSSVCLIPYRPCLLLLSLAWPADSFATCHRFCRHEMSVSVYLRFILFALWRGFLVSTLRACVQSAIFSSCAPFNYCLIWRELLAWRLCRSFALDVVPMVTPYLTCLWPWLCIGSCLRPISVHALWITSLSGRLPPCLVHVFVVLPYRYPGLPV